MLEWLWLVSLLTSSSGHLSLPGYHPAVLTAAKEKRCRRRARRCPPVIYQNAVIVQDPLNLPASHSAYIPLCTHRNSIHVSCSTEKHLELKKLSQKSFAKKKKKNVSLQLHGMSSFIVNQCKVSLSMKLSPYGLCGPTTCVPYHFLFRKGIFTALQ